MTRSPYKFHPGEYLEDELEARGWTTRDAAERVGDGQVDIWQCTFDMLIACSYADEGDAGYEITMGEDTAKALEKALGSSAETWLKLEAAYRATKNN